MASIHLVVCYVVDEIHVVNELTFDMKLGESFTYGI